MWSDKDQVGFMSFRGLVPNDPTVSQYQLWIFDKERDENYPVDGGVFDIVDATDETIVPIQAKLLVHEASLFAVTVEKTWWSRCLGSRTNCRRCLSLRMIDASCTCPHVVLRTRHHSRDGIC